MRRDAGQAAIEDRTERVDVGRGRESVLLDQDLLGCHECRRAGDFLRIDDLAPAGAENALTTLAKACVDNDQLIVAEGEAGFFSTNYGLQALLKTSRSGLALHPDGNEGLSVFKANLPGLNRAELPPGRGFVIEKGKFELLQVALP